ncbi:hypothetical protein [Lewinella sp. LCG006]|uniref:hypothetical protein n=1 Tax=Lewinella sp. LCG006 TaxID=3231911 RepID=UPI00345FA32F
MLRKLRDLAVYLLFLGFTTLLLLEVCYRFYVVDFYKGNLTGLNSAEDLLPDDDRPTVLVMGDSFSADTNSYVKYLRAAIPSHRIINTAVPGTSVRQHSVMAKRRIKRFKPQMLIYQIYVGNDLVEYRHSIRGEKISYLRKWYWWLADRLLVVGYINAKLPQLKAAFVTDPNPGLGTKLSAQFAVEKYNRRTPLYFQVEPDLLEHTVLLKEQRGADFRNYVKDLQAVLDLAAPDCKVVIVVMPHCAQLGTPYLERMQALGGVFEDKAAFLQVDYPFFYDLKRSLSKDNRYFFNALEYLIDEAEGPSYYYENDPHLRPEGQKRVGQALVQFIDSHN